MAMTGSAGTFYAEPILSGLFTMLPINPDRPGIGRRDAVIMRIPSRLTGWTIHGFSRPRSPVRKSPSPRIRRLCFLLRLIDTTFARSRNLLFSKPLFDTFASFFGPVDQLGDRLHGMAIWSNRI